MQFYSARLLYMVLVDGDHPRRRHLYDESVVVFRAQGFRHAFARALQLGRTAETRYRNFRGQWVRWALIDIRTLDRVGLRVDGEEVASRLHVRTAPRSIAFRRRFHPERSRPDHSF